MKKLIPFVFIFAILCGCSSRNIIPNTNMAVDSFAVYSVGDYSFDCHISWDNNVASVVPTTTLASGMILSCDGKNVSFARNDMSKTFPISSLPAYNPALILYQVFSSLSVIHSEMSDNGLVYNGKTSVGNFTLLQSNTGEYISLSIPDANITVEFK